MIWKRAGSGNTAVELIGSNRASLFVNLIPLFGTIAAGIVLAEWSARRV